MPLALEHFDRGVARRLPLQLPPSRGTTARVGAALADLVSEALQLEVELTPKPGLVDRRNTGAHRDMDLATFAASIAALRPHWPAFFATGAAEAGVPAAVALERLRPIGLACERAMFAATFGVNSHKGAIFAFGVLLGAAGRVWAARGVLDRDAICDEVGRIAEGIVARELECRGEPRTAGERLFQRLYLTGARGEAASGYATVRNGSLPVLERALAAGHDRETALLAAFVHLLAHNDDTNLAARGGAAGLAWAKAEAACLLAAGVDTDSFRQRLERLDDAFIARNLSPGGSADLLSLTWLLHRLVRPMSHVGKS